MSAIDPYPQTESRPARGRVHIQGLRWWIAALLLLATLISYIDRLTLSILAPTICNELHLSNLQYAGINVWFLLAYSLGQTLFGKLQDRLGTKLGLFIAMSVWSVAEMLHAAVRTLGGLSFVRFILGAGEGGHWPAAIKGVAEWFPPNQRALAMGIVNTGATLGSTIAPPLIVWLQLSFGWRATFILTGLLGFVWLAVWLFCFHLPGRHPWIQTHELQLIQSSNFAKEPPSADRSWKALLRNRKVMAIVLARLLGDPVWWLYLVWLPLYLSRAHNLDLKGIGFSVWIPFLFADIGALTGGWFSGWLIRHGRQPVRARFIAIVFAATLTPAGAFVFAVPSEITAIALISLVLFAFQFWINNVQTLVTDLFPNRIVASVSGLSGTGAGIGAMIFTLCTGWVVDRFGYAPILILSGLLIPAATVALMGLLFSANDLKSVAQS
jgi:ACS family hexuronate transporter-like MFS transporter